MNSFTAQKISDNVYWVGAIDWNLTDFHGYATQRGTTYNAFLILSEKITLVDTVKKSFFNEMMSRIKSIIDPKKIDYIISNHSELDHSGCLPETIKSIQPEKIFASKRGVSALNEHFEGLETVLTEIKDGQNISLGNMNITFLETPMLHWPDSMISYLDKDKFLFSQDAFGMHLATSERFADQINDYVLEFEASKYYANILLPYSKFILTLTEKIKTSNIPIEILAPDHGPIWRKNISTIPNLYFKWATQKPIKKAVILYDTMWNSTDVMAKAIADGLINGNIKTITMSLKSCHRSDIAHEILDTCALIAGSPTLNDNVFPTIADCLTYLKGLKRKNLIGGIFGSFGWNGKAINELENYFKGMEISIIGTPLKVKYVPTEKDLNDCFNFGKQISEEINKICSLE